ncbi:metallophosphoesterase family protein [Streptomyces sp. NPDC005648]|uniref:metallophosphoesterase family protein n=1 Tax=Streptomyces sp. NPDC005648 TaxID=3157044 RepID=UPI0033B30369
MNHYRPSQAYRPELDIRFTPRKVPGWARPLVEGQVPNSVAWFVVLPRRAGKTWLAQAVERVRPEGTTRRVDLRADPETVRRSGLACLTNPRVVPRTPAGTLVLVDEPALASGGRGEEATKALAAGLGRIRDAGAVPVVLATPAEHGLLGPLLGADSPKDVIMPPALDEAECGRMAERAPDWAPQAVARLGEEDPAWLQTPFLLELALQMCESDPRLSTDIAALGRAAFEEAVTRHAYVDQWFHNGLSEEHRSALRARRWQDAGLPVGAAGQARAGSVVPGEPCTSGTPRSAAVPRAAATDAARLSADPVLARHLPAVLRVHHVSDLHHGGELRTTVDAKDTTEAGRRLAALAGAGSPLESYLDHVRGLARQGLAPHLVIVTGDLVNRPQEEFGRQALDWLRELASCVVDHPDLRPADPRILLAGGNHDVSWDLCLDSEPGARHEWFARVFADYPHPDLHNPDHTRRRLYVRYPDAGLKVALLGSAESGGEPAKDADRARLADFQAEFVSTFDDDEVSALIQDFERLDPGVIARGVLDRLDAEPGYTSLAALHHPLSPVPSVEVAPYSGVINAGQVKRALAVAETALVLHGHTHLAFLAAERFLGGRRSWTTRIAGAPALGSRHTDEQNGYNEILLAREGTRHTVALRTVRLEGGQWVPDAAVAFLPGAEGELPMSHLTCDRATLVESHSG